MKDRYFVEIGFVDQGIHIIAKNEKEAKEKFIKKIHFKQCKCEEISPFRLVIK